MPTTRLKLSSFLSFLRQNRRWFVIGTLLALGLRMVFLLRFRLMTDDSFIYGEIAKNWLQHGSYGQTYDTGIEPGYIRMPGYPMFIILVWLIAGVEHYTAVLIGQMVIDVLTCFVVADLARRIVSERAARIAFLLAALCPFLANYSAVVLTETLAVFFSALAMDMAVAAVHEPERKHYWVLCGIAVAAEILLRPDGGLLLAVIGLFVLIQLVRSHERQLCRQLFTGGLVVAIVALVPLLPWTIRNWRTFHQFQPLTPFSATMPWEFVPHGFQRWSRTWIADYASLEDVWFKVDGAAISVDDLPPRAIDNEAQRAKIEKLFQAYNDNSNRMSPVIDAGFTELAHERIQASPFRYYLKLPFLRAADLWLRPRTEMLPIDPHWNQLLRSDPRQFAWAALLGIINLTYVGGAIFAVIRRRNIRYLWFFVGYAGIRTVFLAWLPNPEPRYVLECYPALLAIAAAAFAGSCSNEAASLVPWRPPTADTLHEN